MQNAPAMLAQKMMNRQAPYRPVGMVSQNMSGNKKGVAGGAVVTAPGLTFDPTSATAGMTFSNNNVTATNSTGGAIASAKGSVTTAIGVSATYYWEFIVNSSGTARFGVGPASFVCNAVNQVGGTASGIAYQTTGSLFGNGSNLGGVSTTTTGDVLGFKLVLGATTSTLTVYKNNVADLSNYNSTSYVTGNGTAWVPIWSSGVTLVSASISNSIYEQAGTIPLGNPVIAASASVPAVADGKYDVYTFNASGTFTTTTTGAVRALVIGGGGGASGRGGSGGAGAGGYQEKGVVTTPQTYAITIGAGGTDVNVGIASSFGGIIISNGGGSGAYLGSKNGGSGGGAFRFTGGGDIAGTGIAGQGFGGGNASFFGTVDDFASAGGGGAGGVGSSATEGTGGNGGPGVTSSITGTAVARGGGGAGTSSQSNGTATAGGGVFGAAAGTANTGGGAGSGTGGTGGSGVVIIRVRARA